MAPIVESTDLDGEKSISSFKIKQRETKGYYVNKNRRSQDHENI